MGGQPRALGKRPFGVFRPPLPEFVPSPPPLRPVAIPERRAAGPSPGPSLTRIGRPGTNGANAVASGKVKVVGSTVRVAVPG